MYELENVPRVATTRPEMILVIHDAEAASYQCRSSTRSRGQAGSVEQVSVAAVPSKRSWSCARTPTPSCGSSRRRSRSSTPFRSKLVGEGEAAPGRRVFYANELRAVG